jgi:hypothetical protein
MRYYTLEMLKHMYSCQYPNLSADTINEKAHRLHTLLNTLDINWRRSNYRFYGRVLLYTY